MRPANVLSVCVAALVGTAACEAGGGGDASAAVSDSAGVRIVEHDASAAASQLVADFDRSLMLTASPAVPMFEIRSAVRLGSGGFAVADGGNHRVVLFDADGTQLTEMGREGEGPGEFQHLTLLASWVADSLVAWDRSSRRVSIISPDGRFVRSFAMESTEDVPFASVTDVFSDGSFHATGFVDVGGGAPAAGRQAYSSPSYHFGPDGSLLAHFGSFPTSETYYEILDRGFRVFPALFGRDAFRLAAGEQLLVASSDRYDLRYLAPDGTLQMIVRRESLDRPVSTAARTAMIERFVEEARPAQAERLREVLGQMETPEVLPEFSEIFVDASGRAWVKEFEVTTSDQTWYVYDREGLLAGSVTLPDGFSPQDAGDDFVLGVMTDELGVEVVLNVPILR